jgi:hypothetical protein
MKARAAAALGCASRGRLHRGGFHEGIRSSTDIVDVPPQADLRAVQALLMAGEEAGIWEFEVGHCASEPML